jgi:hypothetical protein
MQHIDQIGGPSMAKGVDANYRFISASQELTARITQRQQALALYVTLIVSLLAALVALKTSPASNNVPVEWLVLGFPVASLCFVFLHYKAERAITNLRQFMSELERIDDTHKSLPSYNTHPQWSVTANKARRFHDYAGIVLVAGGNATGLGAALGIYPARFAEQPITLWLSIAIGAVSVIGLLINPLWSYAPPARDD